MRFRVLALMLVCAMAAAPSLVVACEVACATAEAAQSAGMPMKHGCHDDAGSTAPAALGATHGCSHDDGELATSGEKATPFVMAFAAIAVFVVQPIPALVTRTAARDLTRARPPDRTPTTTQLRI